MLHKCNLPLQAATIIPPRVQPDSKMACRHRSGGPAGPSRSCRPSSSAPGWLSTAVSSNLPILIKVAMRPRTSTFEQVDICVTRGTRFTITRPPLLRLGRAALVPAKLPDASDRAGQLRQIVPGQVRKERSSASLNPEQLSSFQYGRSLAVQRIRRWVADWSCRQAIKCAMRDMDDCSANLLASGTYSMHP